MNKSKNFQLMIFLTILIFLFAASCKENKNAEDVSKKDIELKEKELALKEKEYSDGGSFTWNLTKIN